MGVFPPRTDARVKPKNGNTCCKPAGHYFDLKPWSIDKKEFGEKSFWAHSFELAFREVDNDAPNTIDALIAAIQRQHLFRISRWPFFRKFLNGAQKTLCDAHLLDDEDLHRLTRFVLSVVIRSPGFRYMRSWCGRPFLSENTYDPKFGTSNIWDCWSTFLHDETLPTSQIGAIFLVTKSGDEFVMGDTFCESLLDLNLTNIETKRFALSGSHRGHILFPITPEVAVLFLLDSRVGQRLCILSHAETEMINFMTCSLSREKIYYRHNDRFTFEPISEGSHRTFTFPEGFFLKNWVEEGLLKRTQGRPFYKLM